MSGNMGSPVGTQKDYDLCDLLRLAPTAKRNYGQNCCLSVRRKRPNPIGQRRVDKPWSHGIHSDSLHCILQGCRLSETRHSVLTGNASYRTSSADEANGRAIIHDRASAALQHLGNLIFHTEPNACQVDRHNAVPILFGRLHYTSIRSDKASIVERVVQATILSNCAIDHLLHVCLFSHIHANAARFSSFVSNRSNCLFRSNDINIADYYSRALSRKGSSGRAPMPEAPPVTTTTLFAMKSAIPILRCNAGATRGLRHEGRLPAQLCVCHRRRVFTSRQFNVIVGGPESAETRTAPHRSQQACCIRPHQQQGWLRVCGSPPWQSLHHEAE